MFSRFSGSLKGAAVHMEQANQQGRLLIAEGIETALAARALFQLPAVAALSANGMRRFEIPATVQIDGDLNSVLNEIRRRKLSRFIRVKEELIKPLYWQNVNCWNAALLLV